MPGSVKNTRKVLRQTLSPMGAGLAFGFENSELTQLTSGPVSQRKRTPLQNDIRSPRWDLPAWQTLQVGFQPVDWKFVTDLEHVRADSDNPDFAATPMIRYREKVEERLRRDLLTETGREHFIRRYFGARLQSFHKSMLDLAFGGGNHVMLLPTAHGKSTLLGVWFPILSAAENPNLAHTICCVNEKDAKQRLRSIRTILETNAELTRDYPWLRKPRRGLWGATEMNIAGRDSSELSPTFWAAGRGNGSIKGHRAITVFDDLEGKDARERSAYREEMRDWFWKEAIRAKYNSEDVERAALIVAGTPFDIDSFYFDLAEREGWEVFRQPYRYENGDLIWPRLQPKIAEFRASMRKLEFAIAMELDPAAGDQNLLTMSEIQRRTSQLRPMPEEAGALVSLDPGTKGGADYAGLAVVRWHWPVEDEFPSFNCFSLKMYYRDLYEQVMECQRLAHRWSLLDPARARAQLPLRVIYETNGRQREDYRSMFKRFAPEIELLEHWSNELNSLKASGYPVIRTMVKKGKIGCFSDPADEESVEGEEQFRKEVRDLGTSRDDHICAALWFIFQHAFRLDRSRRAQQPDQHYRLDAQGTLQLPERPYGYRSPGQLYFNGRPSAGFGSVPERFAG